MMMMMKLPLFELCINCSGLFLGGNLDTDKLSPPAKKCGPYSDLEQVHVADT